MKISGVLLQADAAGGGERSSSRGLWAKMTQGRIFSARVVAVESGDLLSLDIDGRTVVARSGIKLAPGEEIFLEVKDPGPPPLLIPVTADGKNPAILFSRLMALLDRNDPATFASAMTPGRADSATLPLPLFADQPDLQALLRLLAAFLPDKAGRVGRGRSAGDDREGIAPPGHGDIFSLMQQFNAATPGGGGFYGAFPFLYDHGNGYGAWFFSRGDDSGRDTAPSWVAEFFLLLSSLGEVRARVGISAAGIRGDIWLATEAARQYLRRELGDLKDRLVVMSGKTVEITVRSESPGMRAELARVLSAGGGKSLLDTRV